MREIKKTTQTKIDRFWVTSFETTDETEVYTSLTNDLIAKKLNACTYIRSIKRVNNYDGTQTITVTYGTACRNIYTVKN